MKKQRLLALVTLSVVLLLVSSTAFAHEYVNPYNVYAFEEADEIACKILGWAEETEIMKQSMIIESNNQKCFNSELIDAAICEKTGEVPVGYTDVVNAGWLKGVKEIEVEILTHDVAIVYISTDEDCFWVFGVMPYDEYGITMYRVNYDHVKEHLGII